MKNLNGVDINDKYSGGQQDVFVLAILGTDYKGTFVDIGCREPINHSNSALLEMYGWKGVAVDINNYHFDWKRDRPRSKFIQSNALDVDYSNVFKNFEFTNPIDYLSLDLDGNGVAYKCLKKIIDTGLEFKILTVEHDAYAGNAESDMLPQRKLLIDAGYKMVKKCDIIEDFWINPKHIKKENYEFFAYENTHDLSKEKHFWQHCKNIGYDFTKFYDIPH